MSFFNETQTQKIVALAFEAGEIAKKFFKTHNLKIEKKSDNSDVTNADIAISKFFKIELEKEFPQIPVICEEGSLRNVESEIFWLIDPIDGTNSFIEGSNEFAINIALIKKEKPVFGLIYAPVFEGGKMAFVNSENKVSIILGDQKEKILVTKKLDKSNIRIVTSPRTKNEDIQNYIEQFHLKNSNKIIVERLASAVKFFRLIEGDADIYLHLRRSMEWDIAAGHALVEFMNGKVKNFFFNHKDSVVGGEMIYNKSNFENSAFIAEIGEGV